MTDDQSQLDIAGLNLTEDAPAEVVPEAPTKPPAAVEKLIEEAKAAVAEQERSERRSLSLVVVGESYLRIVTAVFITIGPSGAFYTHKRVFGSHPGDGSERFRFGAPLSLLESPLTRHCRRPDITTRVCKMRPKGLSL